MPTYVSILIANPSGLNSNSYLTAADATTYLTQYRLYESLWTSATLQVQETALIWATQMLDRAFDFRGSPTNYYQTLRWPRVGIMDDDGRYINQNSVPNIVAQCTAILAGELIKQDRTLQPALLSLGISMAKIGPLAVNIDAKMILPIIPDFIILWMGKYGEVRPMATNGAKTMKLSRT